MTSQSKTREYSRLIAERLEERSLPSATVPRILSSGLEGGELFSSELFSSVANPTKHLSGSPNRTAAMATAPNAVLPVVGENVASQAPTPTLVHGSANPGQNIAGPSQNITVAPAAASGQLPSYRPQNNNDLVDQLIQQIISQTAAGGVVTYQGFFQNLTGWIYQSWLPAGPANPPPPGVDLGDYYLQGMTGACGQRDLLMEEVAQRLALNAPLDNLEVRRVNFYGVPGQVGHTTTEVFIPTGGSQNQWEFFDATFGTYFTLPGQTTPLDINDARQAFPNVSVMQVSLPAGSNWSGVWATPDKPYTFANLNVVFPSSQSAGLNNTYYASGTSVVTFDIEHTYFISQIEDAGFAPYSYVRLSIDLSSTPTGAIGSADGSSGDTASYLEQQSGNSIPTTIAGATGADGSSDYLTQFFFRAPTGAAASVQLTITTTESQPLLFADVDQLDAKNQDENWTATASANSVAFSFNAYSSGTVLTLYTASNTTLHFDQLQWTSTATATAPAAPIGVQTLSGPQANTLVGYPNFIDMSRNGGSFTLSPIANPELYAIGSINLTQSTNQDISLSPQYVLVAPQLVFYSPDPTTVTLSIPYTGTGSLLIEVVPGLQGTGGKPVATFTPSSFGNQVVLTLDHPFTTVLLLNSLPNGQLNPITYQGNTTPEVGFMLDGANQLWQLHNGGALSTGAFATRIAAGTDPQGNAEVYFTDGNNEVWRYDNGVVTNLGFFATQLAAGRGQLAIIDGNGEVWIYSDSTKELISMRTDALQVVGGSDANGSQFVLREQNNRIVTVDGRGNVSNTIGYGTQITEGRDQDGLLEVWFTDGNNQVWRYDQGLSRPTAAFAKQIAGSLGRLYFLDGDNQIWVLGDNGVSSGTAAFAESIFASTETATYFFLDGNNEIWITENDITFTSNAYARILSII